MNVILNYGLRLRVTNCSAPFRELDTNPANNSFQQTKQMLPRINHFLLSMLFHCLKSDFKTFPRTIPGKIPGKKSFSTVLRKPGEMFAADFSVILAEEFVSNVEGTRIWNYYYHVKLQVNILKNKNVIKHKVIR